MLNQVYQARQETSRIGPAILAIPTLFLVSLDKFHTKRHYHGVLYLSMSLFEYVVGCLCLTTLRDSIAIYIGPSAKEGV